MQKTMDEWLAQAKARYQGGDGAGFAVLADCDPTSAAFNTLRHSLCVSTASCLYMNTIANPHIARQSAPGLRATTYTSLTRSTFADNRALADFLALFLLYVRDSELANPNDVTALSKAFSLLEDCFK